MNIEQFRNLTSLQGAKDADRIVFSDQNQVTTDRQARIGDHAIGSGTADADHCTVRRALLDALHGTFKTGIPESVLKAMNVSGFRSGFAVKNGRVEVSNHPLTMRRLKAILTAADRELARADHVVGRGGQVSKDIAGTSAYRLLTGSLDAVLIAPKKGGSSADIPGNAEIVRDVVGLFVQLAKANGKTDEILCEIGGKDVSLKWENGGTVTATVSGKHLESFSLGTDVRGLLSSLATEICAKPGLFDGSYAYLLSTIPRDARAETSVEPSAARSFAENVIQQVAGVPADRLANVTTANLIDLARDATELFAQGFRGQAAGDTGFETLANPRTLVESRIEELRKVGERDYISSADAATLLEAMRMDAHAEEKVSVPEGFNLERKSGVKLDTAEKRDAAKTAQALRDLAADIVLAEDTTAHDSGAGVGHELIATLARHAETVALLLKADLSDEETVRTVFAGVGEEAKELLLSVFDAFAKDLSMLVLTKNDLQKDTAELAGQIRKKMTDLPTTKYSNRLDLAAAGSLGAAKGKLDKAILRAFKANQAVLKKQIDTTFKADGVKKASELPSIDQMLENAMKPGDTGYSAFVKDVLRDYFDRMSDDDKKAMAAAAMRYTPADATDGQKMAALLKGAGPLLQKILQGLDEKMLGDTDLGNAIRDMKENLAPIPEEVVKANLRDIVVRSGGKLTKIEAVKTLGCASVGQAILCKAFGPGLPPGGKDVVIKVLRPDALQRIEREKTIILEIARNNGMAESYGSQINSILEEFDFKHEAANIDVGKVYDTKAHPRTGAVKVSKLSDPSTGTLLMERAPGSTAESVIKNLDERLARLPDITKPVTIDENNRIVAELKGEYEKLAKMQKDLCDMAKVWVGEALYGSGFFHGDLHGGNIMLDPEKGVTMIDFGNVTQLSPFDKMNITKMMAAAYLGEVPGLEDAGGDPEKLHRKMVSYVHAAEICTKHFMEGLAALLPAQERLKLTTEPLRKDIADMLQCVLSTGRSDDAGKRILVALTELQRMGIEIPGPIFKFSQSQMRLQNTIEQINAKMVDLSTAIRQRQLKPVQDLMGLFQYVNDVSIGTRPTTLRDAVEWLANTGGQSLGVRKASGLLKKYAKGKIDADHIDDNALDAHWDNPDLYDENSDVHKASPLFVLLSLSNDRELANRWNALKARVADLKARNAADGLGRVLLNDGDLQKKIMDFMGSLAKPCKKILVEQFSLIQKQAVEPGEPDTFVTCMGKVIKQNLVATQKRLPLELAKAVLNN